MRVQPSEPSPAGDRDAARRATASAPDDADPRFTLLVARIAERLRPVCHDWDEARFQALVRQVARVKVQWGEAYRPGYPGSD